MYWNDDEGQFRALAGFLRCRSPPPAAVHPLPYPGLGEPKYRRLGRPYPLAGCQTPDRRRLEEMRDLLAEAGVPVRLPD